MKKLITIGIVMFCLLTLAFAESIITSYTYLGFEINETDVVKTRYLDMMCIKINQLDTNSSIMSKILADIEDEIPKNSPKWGLNITIKPLSKSACWSVYVNITTTTNEVIYSDKTIIDNLNNLTYSFKENVWGTRKAISKLESIKKYYCTSDVTKTRKCVSVSGSRCYLETKGKSPWNNCIGGQWQEI